MRSLLSLLFAFIIACCAIGRENKSSCGGEFIFDGIPEPRLRDDALVLIMEFAALDDHVTAERTLVGGEPAIRIGGLGDQCRIFGNSFLTSEMREFQGLRYRETRQASE